MALTRNQETPAERSNQNITFLKRSIISTKNGQNC
jgi:hypothetical protein